jgi:alpha-galactosidase
MVLIKTAWGGKSIHTDFRPPSAGPFPFAVEQLKKFAEQGKDVEKIKAEKAEATGHYYRLMVEHVRKVLGDLKRVYPDYNAAEGYELSGFVWFQGWNDMVAGDVYLKRGEPGSYDAYSEVLTHFIMDVRKDLAAPELPFVIGVMGAGGPIDKYPPEKMRYAGIHGEFRKAMAAPASRPEFQGNVAAVWTEKCWDMELEALRAKDQALQNELKAMVKDGKLDSALEKATLEQRRSGAFTDQERQHLEKGASNAEYHYLGSAKILGCIGKAFAESAYGMMEGASRK